MKSKFELSDSFREAFFMAYSDAAFWAETTHDDAGTPLDRDHTVDDLDETVVARMKKDCDEFLARAGILFFLHDDINLSGNPVAKQAGHDFLLTRNGHGAGFWDGDWKDNLGQLLTDLSREFGEFTMYVGDDGKIYC